MQGDDEAEDASFTIVHNGSLILIEWCFYYLFMAQ